jgi:hypothetical protein
MFEDPIVIAALVAGITSAGISVASGLYLVFQNRRKFDDLRKELIAKESTVRYLNMKDEYLDAYRKFETDLVSINGKNPQDGTEAIQYSINYFANNGRDFYLRNRQFLKTKELENLLKEINDANQAEALNNPNNHQGRLEFGKNIIKFLSELNDSALDDSCK